MANEEYQNWGDAKYPYDLAECGMCLSGHAYGCFHKNHGELREAVQKADLVNLVGKLRKMTYAPGIEEIRKTFLKLRKKYRHYWAILMLLLLAPCGWALPDKPVPKAEHRFYDRIGKVEFGAALTIASLDSAQTCHFLANGGRELWQPTQSCPGNVAILFGGVAAQEGLAYGFHRLGWHKPERLIRIFTIQASSRAILNSARNGVL